MFREGVNKKMVEKSKKRIEIEKRMTPAQLKKMATHYGMGVNCNIGKAATWKPKVKKREKLEGE